MPQPDSPTPHRPDGLVPAAQPVADEPFDEDLDDGDLDDEDPDDEDEPGTGDWDRDLLVRRYGATHADELLAMVAGRPVPHRRIGVVPAVLAVLVAIGLTYAVWAYRSASTGSVGATLVRIETDSDHSVLVTWTVSRDPGTTVSCEVTATDDRGATVGVTEVAVSPGADRATQLITQVQTTGRGLNATIDRCQLVTPAGASRPTPTG